MKKDSFHNYVGKKFLDDKLFAINSSRVERKCRNFIQRVDSMFLELEKIEVPHKKSYIARALQKQFTHELYNDLKLGITPKQKEEFLKEDFHAFGDVEKNIKDEIFGYLKFKATWHSQKQYQKSKRYKPTKKKY